MEKPENELIKLLLPEVIESKKEIILLVGIITILLSSEKDKAVLRRLKARMTRDKNALKVLESKIRPLLKKI